MDASANSIFYGPLRCFQCYAFWWKSFHMPVHKRRQKSLRLSNFALLGSFLNGVMAVKGLMNITPNPIPTPFTSCRTKTSSSTCITPLLISWGPGWFFTIYLRWFFTIYFSWRQSSSTCPLSNICVVQKARVIVDDNSHVLAKHYELLPSGRWFCGPKSNT